MKVHRTKHTANFTIAPNAILREERMSEMARLILLRLLSNTDDYEGATALKMWEDARAIRGDAAPGKRAFLNAFNEMEEFGYLVRTKVREGRKWVTRVDVYDTPQNRSEEPSEDESVGLPGFGKSHGGMPHGGKPESGQSSKRTKEKDASRRTISSSSVSGHAAPEPAPAPEKKTKKTPEQIITDKLTSPEARPQGGPPTPEEATAIKRRVISQAAADGVRIRSTEGYLSGRDVVLLEQDLAAVRGHQTPAAASTGGFTWEEQLRRERAARNGVVGGSRHGVAPREVYDEMAEMTQEQLRDKLFGKAS